MKILVIFTGGTIGSTVHDGWIAPDEATRYTLIHNFIKNNGDEIDFETCTPFSILSETLSAKTLKILVDRVCSAITKDFNGIIVTHGTDTLQFSAAALAYTTGNDCIPTILVSSNFPLDDPRSNGNANFKAAVNFIRGKKGRGVFIAYQNQGAPVEFHNALAVADHIEADDAIFSLYGNVYAKETRGDICVLGKSFPCEKLPAKFAENSRILTIKLHPADGYTYAPENYRAVILRPYHSGTLNTASETFIAFCNRAKNAGIPLYAVNIQGEKTYASSKFFDKLGIIPLLNTTFTAAYIKLWIEHS